MVIEEDPMSFQNFRFLVTLEFSLVYTVDIVTFLEKSIGLQDNNILGN